MIGHKDVQHHSLWQQLRVQLTSFIPKEDDKDDDDDKKEGNDDEVDDAGDEQDEDGQDDLKQSLKGIVLQGDHGIGKVTLAKCLAEETKASYILLPCEVAKSNIWIPLAFKAAKNHLPCILIFEGLQHLVEANQQILSKQIKKMPAHLAVIGTTQEKVHLVSRKWFKSNSRFAALIPVARPNLEERKEMFTTWIEEKTIPISPQEYAELTEGFSGMEIRELIEQAKFLIFPEQRPMAQEDFKRAFLKMHGIDIHTPFPVEKNAIEMRAMARAAVVAITTDDCNGVLMAHLYQSPCESQGLLYTETDSSKKLKRFQTFATQENSILRHLIEREIQRRTVNNFAVHDCMVHIRRTLFQMAEAGSLPTLLLWDTRARDKADKIDNKNFEAQTNYLQQLHDRVINILKEHQAAIERLTKRLLQKKILTRHEILATLKQDVQE